MLDLRIRRSGFTAVGFAVAASAAVLAAPMAAASVYGLSIENAGGDHYVDTPYKLTAGLGGGFYLNTTVTFSDNGTVLGTVGPTAIYDANGVAVAGNAYFTWTPKTTGTHTIVAEQLTPEANAIPQQTITVTVTQTPAPAPAPKTGSADSIPVLGGLLSALGL
ncbi:hypothetical protein ACWEOI_05885 [Nocardia sp. NPDC004340]|uniref:hypothetical protein n=1 Tax=Nocardia sp. CA-136227 TaxID=3239979 RepID=UPI003D97B07F